jgi:type IV secretion system protein VirD4
MIFNKNKSNVIMWDSMLNKINKTDAKDIKNNKESDNIILTNNIYLNMDTKKTKLNDNVIVIGDAGTGKTNLFVKPNLLQANCSYVINDPYGEMYETCSQFLKNEGYEIKVLNLMSVNYSNYYNPFNYIKEDIDVFKLVDCIFKSTTSSGLSCDQFIEKAEKNILNTLILYLIKYRPKEEQNFTSVLNLLDSNLDKLFNELAIYDPDSKVLKYYTSFKMGADRISKSILRSCYLKLSIFIDKNIEKLTSIDDIDLESVGDRKQALFIIAPNNDNKYDVFTSMFYYQLLDILYKQAEINGENGKLNCHVRFILDEFATLGRIPDFENKIVNMRIREISCSIIIQNIKQLKEIYGTGWESIIGNCDSLLYLGSQEHETIQYINKILNFKKVSNQDNLTNKRSTFSKNKNTDNSNINDGDFYIDNNSCILLIKTLEPIFDKKYEISNHKNYEKLINVNKEDFRLKRWLSCENI